MGLLFSGRYAACARCFCRYSQRLCTTILLTASSVKQMVTLFHALVHGQASESGVELRHLLRLLRRGVLGRLQEAANVSRLRVLGVQHELVATTCFADDAVSNIVDNPGT